MYKYRVKFHDVLFLSFPCFKKIENTSMLRGQYTKQKVRNSEKQNRESTVGYSKSIVRKNNEKFGKRIGLK